MEILTLNNEYIYNEWFVKECVSQELLTSKKGNQFFSFVSVSKSSFMFHWYQRVLRWIPHISDLQFLIKY